MPARVINEKEIYLNGNYYKLAEPIRPSLVNQYAPKVVIGETTSDSLQRRSSIRWRDHRGGIGVDRISDTDVALGRKLDRCWYSSAYLRHDGHLTLPALATITASSGVSGIFTVGAMGDLGDVMYAAFGTSVRSYSLVADSWTSVATLPAVATDAITVRLGATTYLIFATSGGYTWSSDGGVGTWTNDPKATQYMTFWDNRLWGIDSTGQLWYAFSISVQSNDAQLPLPNNYVTDLFVERDAQGEPIIYAGTKVGLFAHDVETGRLIQTELDLPFHNDAGRGVKRWRGATEYPAGLAAYAYQPGPTAQISLVGPDRDDGLPANRKGTVIGFDASHSELLALVDSTSAAANNFDVFSENHLNEAMVMDANAGVSLILGYDGRGWQVRWESAANTEAISSSHVSNAHGGYRLWWGHNRRVYYQTLPVDIENPSQTSNFNYALAFTHDFPWLMVGQETNGLALRLRIETRGMSSTETITPSYALNFDDTTFTAFAAITTDGITTYSFPNSTTPTGTAFRSIRIRLVAARGSNTLLSPDVVAANLEWRKKLPAEYSWTAILDLNGDYGGNTPTQQRANLVTAAASNALIEFTYRDDAGNTRNYYVDVIGQTGLEFTGHDEKGTVALQLAQT